VKTLQNNKSLQFFNDDFKWNKILQLPKWSHASTVVQGKLLESLLVLKFRPIICVPHSFPTHEPRITNIGIDHLVLNLIASAELCSDQSMGAGAPQPPFCVAFAFFC
jgi:hypothetical protein